MRTFRRRCGTPRPGLYAIGTMARNGTLCRCTAIAAPVLAEIANPRAAERCQIRESLQAGLGLVRPDPALEERLAGLPLVGMADLWGMAAGYATPWDALSETRALGACRRIGAVPRQRLPFPLLMLHMRAMPTHFGDWEGWMEGLDKIGSSPQEEQIRLDNQPWRGASSLGRRGDDPLFWHPLVRLWEFVARPEGADWAREMGLEFRQGIIGLTWITDFVQILRPDQEQVDPELAKRGVLPAYAPDDPRATDSVEGGR